MLTTVTIAIATVRPYRTAFRLRALILPTFPLPYRWMRPVPFGRALAGGIAGCSCAARNPVGTRKTMRKPRPRSSGPESPGLGIARAHPGKWSRSPTSSIGPAVDCPAKVRDFIEDDPGTGSLRPFREPVLDHLVERPGRARMDQSHLARRRAPFVDRGANRFVRLMDQEVVLSARSPAICGGGEKREELLPGEARGRPTGRHILEAGQELDQLARRGRWLPRRGTRTGLETSRFGLLSSGFLGNPIGDDDGRIWAVQVDPGHRDGMWLEPRVMGERRDRCPILVDPMGAPDPEDGRVAYSDGAGQRAAGPGFPVRRSLLQGLRYDRAKGDVRKPTA